MGRGTGAVLLGIVCVELGGGVEGHCAHAHGRLIVFPPHTYHHHCRFWAAATIKNGWEGDDNSVSTLPPANTDSVLH